MDVRMRSPLAALAAALLFALVACRGPLSAGSYAPPAAPAGLSATPQSAPDCAGSGKVRVRPCPVTLTKKHPEVDVFVSGPNVVDSAEQTNKKNHGFCGHVCSVGRDFSDYLEWTISAGTKCGHVVQGFIGYDQGGSTVGIGKLKIVNKDC